MQSDFLDNRIKEAADHHHPAYDEHAWRRMEKLLDKHLPLKEENNRRFLFILFLFALLGGGAWLLIDKPWKKEKQIVNNESVQRPSETVTATEEKQSNVPTANNTVVFTPDSKNVPTENNQSTITPANVPEKRIVLNTQRKVDPLTAAILDRRSIKKNEGVSNKSAPANEVMTPEPVISAPVVNDAANIEKPETVNDKKDVSVKLEKSENTPTNKNEIRKDEPTTVAPKSQVKNKKTPKAASPFFLIASAGPDISFAGTDNLGHTRLLGGIGAGYTFKDRITVRTGFYSGRKIYSALPGDYNPPAEFWNYYPYLEKVDANCRIYEIPLNVSYNFGRTEKQRFFASVGVSSYLMREETYNYTFKYTPTSPTYQKKYTIENENKHFLSVLTVSAGYKRNLSKRVFVTAEPYLKLPYKGLGYGKVKLNSGGVMFTIGVRPFNASSNTRSK